MEEIRAYKCADGKIFKSRTVALLHEEDYFSDKVQFWFNNCRYSVYSTDLCPMRNLSLFQKMLACEAILVEDAETLEFLKHLVKNNIPEVWEDFEDVTPGKVYFSHPNNATSKFVYMPSVEQEILIGRRFVLE